MEHRMLATVPNIKVQLKLQRYNSFAGLDGRWRWISFRV